MPKLKELNIDHNPGSRNLKLHYEIILRVPKLRILNEDAVKELDRDIAVRFFEDEGYALPQPDAQKPKVPLGEWTNPPEADENKDEPASSVLRSESSKAASFLKPKKSVCFAAQDTMTNEDQAKEIIELQNRIQ